MKNTFILPSREDCIIEIVCPDKKVECDAFEVRDIYNKALEATQQGSEAIDTFINFMHDRFDFKLTYAGARLLLIETMNIVTSLKKKCTPLPDLESITDSAPSISNPGTSPA